MSETMRAVTMHRYGDASVLKTETVARPAIGDEELLVAVKASGINPIDFKTRNGQGVNRGWGDDPFPVILGWDIAGMVVESKSAHFAAGDAVYAMPRFPDLSTGYAEYVSVPEADAAPKPANITFTEAAAVPLAALTAWQALVDTAKIGAGAKVLVQAAAGGVGHFAVQIAKHHGADVTGTGSARNEEFIRGLGADHFIDYTASDVGEAVSGMDVAFHTLTPDSRDISWRTLKPGGHLISITGPVEEDEQQKYGGRADFVMVRPSGAELAEIGHLIEAGAIVPEVDTVYPLEQTAEAHRHVEAGHTRGKVVLHVAD